MSKPTDWPEYDIGPHDVLHALGVVSVTYDILETALVHLFSHATDTSHALAQAIFARTSNDARIAILKSQIPSEWPEENKDALAYFIEGYDICAENRNHLMHSHVHNAEPGFELTERPEETLLVKRNKRGRHTSTTLDIEKLRLVADEMFRFAGYGLDIGMAMIVKIHETGEPLPLPDRPPLPLRLHYTP